MNHEQSMFAFNGGAAWPGSSRRAMRPRRPIATRATKGTRLEDGERWRGPKGSGADSRELEPRQRAQGGEASSKRQATPLPAGWGYPGWGHGGYGTDLVDAASGLLTLGVLPVAEPYGHGYGYPGTRYAYGCVQTYWDPGVGYVRVRAPCP